MALFYSDKYYLQKLNIYALCMPHCFIVFYMPIIVEH